MNGEGSGATRQPEHQVKYHMPYYLRQQIGKITACAQQSPEFNSFVLLVMLNSKR
jgi:hypothetical protein